MTTYIINEIKKESALNVCTWKYDPPYDLYNMDGNAFSALLSNGYYEVKNEHQELVGFLCFGKDAQVPGGRYENGPVDIGLGLRPDLTGKGHGMAFLEAGINFAKQSFNVHKVRLTVAEFNERAIKVYEKSGFKKSGTFINPKTNKTFIMMEYQR
jgi:[ribosomal protein S18]-alanine N-acetyltransferase